MPSSRSLTPELMDDPAVPREDLARSLRYLRFINAHLAGAGPLIRYLARESRAWPRNEPITLLDIATGFADIPIAARRWAVRNKFDLRITAVDLHEATLALAQENLAQQPPEIREAITLTRADALYLIESPSSAHAPITEPPVCHPLTVSPAHPLSPPSLQTSKPSASPPSVAPSLRPFVPSAFHYCHTSLFLHHLPDIEILTVLAQMDRLSTRALIWNDLLRSPAHAAVARLATLFSPRIVQHDALASVRAAFTKREALDYAHRAGLPRARCSLLFPPYRFTLISEKAPIGPIDRAH